MSGNVSLELLNVVLQKTRELYIFDAAVMPARQNVLEQAADFGDEDSMPSEFYIFLGYNAFLLVKPTYASRGQIKIIAELSHEERQRWIFLMKQLCRDVFFDASSTIPTDLLCEKPEVVEQSDSVSETEEADKDAAHLDELDLDDLVKEAELEEDESSDAGDEPYVITPKEVEPEVGQSVIEYPSVDEEPYVVTPKEVEPEVSQSVIEYPSKEEEAVVECVQITPFILITRQNTIDVSVCPHCLLVEEVGEQYCSRCHHKFEVEECDHCGQFNYAGHKQCLHCEHKFVEDKVESEEESSQSTHLDSKDEHEDGPEVKCPECKKYFRESYMEDDECPYCSETIVKCDHCGVWNEDRDFEDSICVHCEKNYNEIPCPHCELGILSDLDECSNCDEKLEMVSCPHEDCEMRFYKGLEECPACEENVGECPNCGSVQEGWDEDEAHNSSCDKCGGSFLQVECPHCNKEIAAGLQECPKCSKALIRTDCPNVDCELNTEEILYVGLTQCPYCVGTFVECINPNCFSMLLKGHVDSQEIENEDCYCSKCDTLQMKVNCPHCHVEIASGLSLCPSCDKALESFDCPNEYCADYNSEPLSVYKGKEQCPWCKEKLVECPHCQAMTSAGKTCQHCEKALIEMPCPYCHADICAELDECPKCGESLTLVDCPADDCCLDDDYEHTTQLYVGLTTCPVCNKSLRNCIKCKTLMVSDGRTIKCNDCIE
ncbi:hypothetical protein HN858_01325 [Candidatus Falkowbacteria bacterium]|jgi:hypothetical protein|nr:hypothetical protein [Candidatus Falkowbacteria bacterium]MBT5502769.1 hypothetical protein [Candidatus Falkowbacteria bacterium]MBT6573448.1 hypothetical protein [Candidatus Falkowbacteria bacterium]MBT7348295.1 hypothetical protein [Candidatus Falkowbacteria bacterium]MBT7501167.1 hypothetical protein [Candidatus Falkowbacteria bacterium]